MKRLVHSYKFDICIICIILYNMDGCLREQMILNERLITLCGASPTNIDDIRKSVEMGADINYHCSSVGNTPLMILSRNNYSDNYNTCKFLLDAGASIDIRNHYGNTVLMYSLHDNNILKLILKYDPNIYLKNVLNDNVLNMVFNMTENNTNPNNRHRLTELMYILEYHIEKKKLLIVQKRLKLGQLFNSDLGNNLVEEGLYEQISSFV